MQRSRRFWPEINVHLRPNSVMPLLMPQGMCHVMSSHMTFPPGVRLREIIFDCYSLAFTFVVPCSDPIVTTVNQQLLLANASMSGQSIMAGNKEDMGDGANMGSSSGASSPGSIKKKKSGKKSGIPKVSASRCY